MPNDKIGQHEDQNKRQCHTDILQIILSFLVSILGGWTYLPIKTRKNEKLVSNNNHFIFALPLPYSKILGKNSRR